MTGTVQTPSFVSRVVHHHLFWPVVALVALWIACGVVSPGFLDVKVVDGHLFGQLVDITRNSVTFLLLALGMCLVIATGGIDLSVGAVMAISLAVALTYIDNSGNGESATVALTAVAIALGVAAVVGAFNGFLIAGLGIQPFIATMIILVAGRGIALAFTGGQITTTHSAPFKSIGSGFVLGIPTPVVIGAVVFAIVALLVRKTALGMLLESVGINRTASHMAGVRSRNITWLVYILCGTLAGLAGLVYGAPTMAADANNIGQLMELNAIMAVVIGGTKLDGGKFSLAGTIVGALILTTLDRAVIIFHLPSESKDLFKAIVVIAICIAGSERLRDSIGLRRRPRLDSSTPAPKKTAEVAA
ncbi:ABC transporter permease [Cellulomonas sp. DKR-3]|uniref:ABC transporter permease n=1 Tax=Cellulomonas fulva TaxID=2835530 RepID=A0ABS5TYJ0_9CELL|nr:ABC transporter permease [Cellulomonas fulva]MBT0994192.1 ABC transporter permease [Cellulomonas fulva]